MQTRAAWRVTVSEFASHDFLSTAHAEIAFRLLSRVGGFKDKGRCVKI